MVQPLAGPGQLLPLPNTLYPAWLTGGMEVQSGNEITLPPGGALPIPRGSWYVEVFGYAVLQYYDPLTTTWRSFSSARSSPMLIESDGFNIRAANLTGCAVGAIVTTAGSGYTSAPTITPASGNSTWLGVVGGLVNTASVTAAGAGYGIPPLVFCPPPPSPGVQANFAATIANGTVSAITVIDQGAGYKVAPAITIQPNPADPNVVAGSSITNATATATLTGANTLAAVLCTNNGAAFTSVPALTISGGGGTLGAATVVPMWTITGTSLVNGGAGYNSDNLITTVGGTPVGTAARTNPAIELTGYIPRQAQFGVSTLNGTTIGTVGVVIDGGLFMSSPTVMALSGTTPATITPSIGSVNATIILQPVG